MYRVYSVDTDNILMWPRDKGDDYLWVLFVGYGVKRRPQRNSQ
jgi:hypothetical protein